MNGLNNLDKTDVDYSLAHTDDLIRFCRSKAKVKVTTWFKYGMTKASTPTLDVDVYLLVIVLFHVLLNLVTVFLLLNALILFCLVICSEAKKVARFALTSAVTTKT